MRSGEMEIGLLLRAVVARVKLVAIGEHPERLRHIRFVRKAQPHRVSILKCVLQVQLPTFQVVSTTPLGGQEFRTIRLKFAPAVLPLEANLQVDGAPGVGLEPTTYGLTVRRSAG